MSLINSRITFTLLGLLASCTWVQAQKQIRVKGDENVLKVISLADRYRYPQFTTGTVTYRNGVAGTGQLNYNRLLGEIQFIGPKGDTLALADEQNIAHVTIGSSKFYVYQGQGCLEVIADHGSVKLAKRVVFESMRSEKKVAYGQSSGASSVATVQPFANNSSIHRIESAGDRMIQENVSYFILDQNDRAYLITKSVIFKVFSKHKKAIETYLNENIVHYTEEADLRRLIQFCSELS
jgi:hypothetical protein